MLLDFQHSPSSKVLPLFDQSAPAGTLNLDRIPGSDPLDGRVLDTALIQTTHLPLPHPLSPLSPILCTPQLLVPSIPCLQISPPLPLTPTRAMERSVFSP